MTLPRMAVKPHSTTQRWICHWALAAGVMVGVGREARALSRRAGHLAHIPRSKTSLPNPSGPPDQLAGGSWRAHPWFAKADRKHGGSGYGVSVSGHLGERRNIKKK